MPSSLPNSGGTAGSLAGFGGGNALERPGVPVSLHQTLSGALPATGRSKSWPWGICLGLQEKYFCLLRVWQKLGRVGGSPGKTARDEALEEQGLAACLLSTPPTHLPAHLPLISYCPMGPRRQCQARAWMGAQILKGRQMGAEVSELP